MNNINDKDNFIMKKFASNTTMNFYSNKNDFNKTRIIGYLFWFLIMVIGSQFISYFFDLGCLINNPSEDYKTINTIQTIYVSFYVFGAIFFILIS